MPINEFYVQTTGSNLNSGSTTSDTASVTQTGGNWSTVTNEFIASSGTPFAGVSAGDWVSIYNDGASVSPFIAQVTAVNGGGSSLVVSTTARYGTAPTTSTTARSCKVGGAIASPPITGQAFVSGTAYNSTRLNIKSGTYTGTYDTLTGTAVFPVMLRGYDATVGDLDGTFGGPRPVLSVSSAFAVRAATQLSNLRIQTSANSTCMSSNNLANVFLCNIDVDNSNTGSSAVAASFNNITQFAAVGCRFSAASTTANCVSLLRGQPFFGCVFVGGNHGLHITNANSLILQNCLVRGAASNGVYIAAAGGTSVLLNNTIDGCGLSGIRSDATSGYITILNNILSNNGLYGFNNTVSASNTSINLVNNGYFNNTSGSVFGLGDQPEITPVSFASDPFVNRAGGDYTPAAVARAIGFPGVMNGESYRGFLDLGAIQHEDAGGGGGSGVSGSRIFTGF